MPINLPPLTRNVQFKPGLDPIPSGASSSELKSLVDSNWETITRGKEPVISGGEAAWLHAVMSQGDDIATYVAAKISDAGVKIGSAAKGLGFDVALQAATDTFVAPPVAPIVPPVVINPAPPSAPVGGTPYSMAEVNPKLTVEGPYQVPTMAKLPAEIADLFGSPEEMLSLDVLKSTVNGPNLQTASDAFRSQLFVGIGAMVEQLPLENLKAIKDVVGITVSNVEVLLNPEATKREDRMGIRASTYSSVQGPHGKEWPELTKIVHAMGDDLTQKQMMHRKDSHAVGGPGAIVGHDHALEFTSTHEGWFDPAFDENGTPVLVRGDYPTDYGDPPTGTGEYSFRGLQYTKKAILELLPADEAQFFEQNPAAYREHVDFARTLGALSMGKVNFSSNDLDPHDQSYFVNDLDLDSSSKMGRWLDALGGKLSDQIEGRDGDMVDVQTFVDRRSRYCAEGANDRPMFLCHAKPTEALHEMKKIFDAAVSADQASTGKPNPDNRKGWKALEDAGYINNYSDLETINAAYLPFVVPDIAGHKSLAERGLNVLKGDTVGESGDGLLHQPVSIAGMVEGALGTLLPRQKIADALSQQIKDAFANPPAGATKQGILQEAGGLLKQSIDGARAALTGAGVPDAVAAQMVPEPDLSTLDSIADGVGLALAAQVQLGVLKDPKIQAQIHKQIRRELMDDAGQTRVDQLLGEYMQMVGNPTMGEKQLHVALDKKNDETRNETFTFNFTDPSGNPRVVKDRPIVYLAPHAESLKTVGFLQQRGTEYLGDFFPDGFAKA